MLYKLELRQFNDKAALDERVIILLERLLVKRAPGGEIVLFLEVSSPLVSERIRQLERQIGYLTYGSISPSVIKFSRRAFCRTDRAPNSEARAKARADWGIQGGAPI